MRFIQVFSKNKIYLYSLYSCIELGFNILISVYLACINIDIQNMILFWIFTFIYIFVKTTKYTFLFL